MNPKNPGWQPVEPLRKFQSAGGRRRMRTDSGKTRTIPALPYEYWCKPSGNLVRLAVMTTRNVKQAVNGAYYANYARAQANKDEWFAWEWNDAQAYSPKYVVKSGAETKEQWEKWREEELLRRRTVHNDQTAKASAAWFDAAGQRKLESKEAFTDAIKDFTEAMKQAQSQAQERKKSQNG